MKFVWNEPEARPNLTDPHYTYPKANWVTPVWAWLSYLGIWNNPRTEPHKPLNYNELGYLIPDSYYDPRNLLKFSGCGLHADHKQWDLYYNFVYHFYDLTIYESWVPGTEPRGAIDRMTAYLKTSGLTWKADSAAWVWDTDASGKKVMRPGIRFWIYAEDHIRPEAKPRPKRVKLVFNDRTRYVTIPEGWHRVTDGVVLKDDKVYYAYGTRPGPGFHGSDTVPSMADKVGRLVKAFICVIRKD